MERILIKFNDILPKEISVSKLADLLKSFEAVLLSKLPKKRDRKKDAPELIVSLENIYENCTAVSLRMDQELASIASKLLPSISTDDNRDRSVKIRKFATALNVFSDYYETRPDFFYVENGEEKPIFSYTPTETVVPEKRTYSSVTSRYGRVISVGGVTPKVRIKFDDEVTLSCDTENENIVYEAASLLYKQVLVKGYGTFTLSEDTKIMEKFTIESISEFEPLGGNELAEKLSPYVEEQVERIEDPADYFRKIRETD
ncbi:MAG: hypothetical protein LHW55_02740 [Candidatus Cloacimonetes bacterium]|nr:hypothetical protein [Candidatus Cloacimonadota bacterium]